MTPADKPDFVKQLLGLAAIKPGGAKLTTESYDIYFNALSDWTLDEIKAAASHLAKACQFMPSPYDFEQLRKAGRAVPAEAWSKARAIARAWRPNTTTPSSGNEIVDRAVESVGGYRAIAMCNVDAMGFLEKRFIDAFESIQDAEDTRGAVPEIAYTAPTPRLSGPRDMRDGLQRLVSGVKS